MPDSASSRGSHRGAQPAACSSGAASALDSWFVDGLASGMPELVHFASGLPLEQSAVQAALNLPYSNGQVEGQMTTLIRLKRQSYGRAKLDLLRQRMLHAA